MSQGVRSETDFAPRPGCSRSVARARQNVYPRPLAQKALPYAIEDKGRCDELLCEADVPCGLWPVDNARAAGVLGSKTHTETVPVCAKPYHRCHNGPWTPLGV